ncbi:response regulator transcription factor [Permianibacter aggregans]|nr:response regulator [Permianibacter aggregans]
MFITLSTLRLLIVDDQALIRTAMRHMLMTLGAKHIDEAVSGEQAIERLLGTQYDLVVSDIDMSPVNGLQLLQHIRTGDYGLKRETLFIMLTGVATKEFVTTCINLDVNAFLTKPPKKELIMSRLQYALTTPFKIKEPQEYQKLVLPELAASEPNGNNGGIKAAAGPTASPALTSTKRTATTRDDKQQRQEDDEKAHEPGMFYIIWSDKLSTGIPSIDELLKRSTQLMNRAYSGRGQVFPDGVQDQFVQECFIFATDLLRQMETTVAPCGQELVRKFVENRVGLSASLARTRLVMQISPELVNYEVFNAMKFWWQNVSKLLAEHREKLTKT